MGSLSTLASAAMMLSMRRVAWAFVLLAIACHERPRGPSPEYTRAMSRFDKVMSETLDPSYADERFDEVEVLLRAVPKSTPEQSPAFALADQIAEGRQKQRAFQARLEAEANRPAEPPPLEAPAAVEDEEAPSAPQDAPAPRDTSAQIAQDAPSPGAAGALPTERRRRPSEPVILYTTSWCGYCKRAKAYLSAAQIDFVEHDVEEDDRARDDANRKRRQNNLRSGVPLIEVDGEFLVGFSDGSMQRLLKKHGYL